MIRRALLCVVVAAFCTSVVLVGNQYRLVETQTGEVVKCLDPKHSGNPELSSSIMIARVHRRDAAKCGIVTKSLVCEKCQERARLEDQQAKSLAQKEDAFIAALRRHDDQVLLCCRRMAGAGDADPSRIYQLVRRDIDQLRRLALTGKQLCAPETLGEVETLYGKSMDELLRSLPYTEQGLKHCDADAMQKSGLHLLLSKRYRDRAMALVEGRHPD